MGMRTGMRPHSSVIPLVLQPMRDRGTREAVADPVIMTVLSP
jgi:hypothetical protein